MSKRVMDNVHGLCATCGAPWFLHPSLTEHPENAPAPPRMDGEIPVLVPCPECSTPPMSVSHVPNRCPKAPPRMETCPLVDCTIQEEHYHQVAGRPMWGTSPAPAPAKASETGQFDFVAHDLEPDAYPAPPPASTGETCPTCRAAPGALHRNCHPAREAASTGETCPRCNTAEVDHGPVCPTIGAYVCHAEEGIIEAMASPDRDRDFETHLKADLGRARWSHPVPPREAGTIDWNTKLDDFIVTLPPEVFPILRARLAEKQSAPPREAGTRMAEECAICGPSGHSACGQFIRRVRAVSPICFAQ